MREIALHILDIMQNSIRAKATCIELKIEEIPSRNQLIICIKDNGKGMPESMRETVRDPFTTTRTLRKVGLGIPLLNQLCEECEGELIIASEERKGTELRAMMQYDHIDRLPLGDVASTMYSLIMARPDRHYIYEHCYEEESFRFDTEEILEMLEGVPINQADILLWIKEYLTQNREALYRE